MRCCGSGRVGRRGGSGWYARGGFLEKELDKQLGEGLEKAVVSSRSAKVATSGKVGLGPTSLAGSSSAFVGVLGTTPLGRRAMADAPVDERWRPACSRSTSDHDRIDESTVSISNRFGSARGVVRNEIRMLVTRRLRGRVGCSKLRSSQPGKRAGRMVECDVPIDISVRRVAPESTECLGEMLVHDHSCKEKRKGASQHLHFPCRRCTRLTLVPQLSNQQVLLPDLPFQRL